MLGKIIDGILENGYVPHEAQELIHDDETRFRICVCGRRFGKTLLALNEIYKAAWENTDKLARIWYVAPNYRQAKEVAWEMLKEVVPEQIIAAVNEAELSMRLINQTTISLKGADAQDSLRGSKLKFVVLDEYASMRPTVWDEIIRPALADVRGSRGLFISTPSGMNHFKTLYDRGLSGDKEYKSFHFKTSDNPYIEQAEIDEIKKKTDPTIFRQEYEGSFEQMAGSIYPMFKRDIHVVRPRELPEFWDYAVAMDWGSRNATAILFSRISPSGEIWIYDMLYGPSKTVLEWSEILKARHDIGLIKDWIIDPSALAQTREFAQYGIFFRSYNPETMKRINDVTIGINLTAQYFLEGKIKIFEHCDVLINQIEQYQWQPYTSKLGTDPMPKPLKKDDHSVDGLRYLVSTRSKGSEAKRDKYKGLNAGSELFWRSHNNDFPKEVQSVLYPRESIPYDLDDIYPGDDMMI